jgi:NADH-quinone oxidoreductase subunit J
MLFSTLLFYIFSFALIACAILVAISKNTVHGVLFLILCFVNASGLFILLGAEFLAMLLIIVYVGAIAVLFLFVVMMLNIDEIPKIAKKINLPFAAIISLILIVEIFLIIRSSYLTSKDLPKAILYKTNNSITNTESIGNILYTDFIFPFQLSGAILFVAMIGAIALTLRDNERFIRKQNISDQVNRSTKDSVEVVQVESNKGIDV